MADFGKTLSGLWSKGMSEIGSTASSIAKAANFKADEMGLVAQRRELVQSLGEKAYSLYRSGVKFPDEFEAILKQIDELDGQLDTLRSDYKQSDKTAAQPESQAYEIPPVAARTAPSLQVEQRPVPAYQEETIVPVSQHEAPKIDVDAAYTAAETPENQQ